MSKRRSTRGKAISIDASDIKFDNTCINILPGGLPLSLSCDICKPQLDIHSKRSSKPDKKFRNKHPSNRCQQLWTSKWGKDNKTMTDGLAIKHATTRRFLGIAQDVTIEYESAYKKIKLILQIYLKMQVIT